MGSDESHLNVSVGNWWTKSQDSVHKPQPFWRGRRAEAVSNRGPSAYQPNALPLEQTGSHVHVGHGCTSVRRAHLRATPGAWTLVNSLEISIVIFGALVFVFEIPILPIEWETTPTSLADPAIHKIMHSLHSRDWEGGTKSKTYIQELHKNIPEG